MKRKEKIIGSLILAIIVILFLFIGYSKTKDTNLSESEKEKLFLEEEEDFKEEESEFSLKDVDNKDLHKNVDKDLDNNEENLKEDNSTYEKIVVEIKGEVKRPDVYEIDKGSRINDLIEKAGGITEEADLSNINRALYLKDGECVVIRNLNQKEKEDVEELNKGVTEKIEDLSGGLNEGEKEDIVDINKASKEELMNLKGIGESKAEDIIEYREKIGYFKNIEELKEVKGIGEKTFDNIKDKISIG